MPCFKLFSHKKGFTIAQLPSIAVIFGLGIVVLSVMSNILGTYQDDIELDSSSVVNESDATNLVWGNNTNMTLNYKPVIAVSAVYNCSAGADFTTIGSGNYTVFLTDGKIQCDTNQSISENGTFPHDSNPVCVNYTYTTYPTVYNITGKGLVGMVKVANWYPTIGTVIGAAIIITALFFLWKRKD